MPTPNAFQWTDDVIAKMRVLWDEGVSMSEIGRQLKCGKNAACGKIHRLNFPPRPSPIRASGQPRKIGALKHTESAATARALLPVVSDSGVTALAPAGREKATRAYAVKRVSKCAFIHGDVRAGGWKYCDAPTVPGNSYCGFHFSICTVPARDRREDAA